MQLPTLALFWISARSVECFLRKIKNTSESDLLEAYVGTVQREKAGNTCWDLIGLIPHTIIL